jgi:hypothetical protein
MALAWPWIFDAPFVAGGVGAQVDAGGWNFHSRIETALDFLKALLRELVPLPGHRWTKKSCGSLVAQLLAGPLHADQGHSEGA